MKNLLSLLAFSPFMFSSFLNSNSEATLPKTPHVITPKTKINYLSRLAPNMIFPYTQANYFYLYLSDVTILESANGQYKLVLQADHNLVLYKNFPLTALWDSGTQNYTNITCARFQTNGNLYLTHGSNGYSWWDAQVQMAAPVPYFHWVLQDDGNFVRYADNGGTVATGTQGGRISPHKRHLK